MFFPILTYTRSGSTWLADIISNRTIYTIDTAQPGDTVNLHEYFNDDVGNNKLKQLGYLSENTNTRTVSGFEKLYELFEKKQINFTLKLFNSHLPLISENKNDMCVSKLLEYSDIVVHNYRKNILHSWISRRRVGETGIWQGTREKRNLKNKVHWDRDAFLGYSRHRKQVFNDRVSLLKKSNIQPIEIVYEDLHRTGNRFNFLSEKCKRCNIQLYSTHICKFSNPNLKIEDNFVNKQQFLDDYASVQEYITL